MNKKTLTLIVALFLVTCGLLYLALRTPSYKKPVSLGPTPTPISVNAHTLLSLVAAPASESSQTAEYTVAVTIDTQKNPVNSVQLEIAYDPQALINVTVKQGTFFQQPSTLINSINTTDGRISYVTSEQIDIPGHNGTGSLALISFDKSPTFTGRTTTLQFLPKTTVAADKIFESVLRKTSNYRLTFTQPSATPEVKPSSASESAQ